MGGAERNQRARAQQQNRTASGSRPGARPSQKSSSKALASARGRTSSRNKFIAGAVVIVVIVAAVVVAVVVSNGQKQSQASAPIHPERIHTSYPVSAHGGVVTAGKKSAPVTVDMYEDFICPYCGKLHQASGKAVEQALGNGKLRVHFHMVNFLDGNSNPPGYSTRAANAAIAAAHDGQWASFYNSLYADQPEEGSAGYSKDQLVSLGKKLGMGKQFADAVRNEKYKAAVGQDSKRAKQSGKITGTPTVLHDGKKVRISRGNHYYNWVAPLVNKSK
jgi:protein-disulfide isomerase